MSKALDNEIRSRMEKRTTESLLAIWNENDYRGWSQETFDVIREILLERGVPLPKQGQTVQLPPLGQPASKKNGIFAFFFSVGALVVGFSLVGLYGTLVKEMYQLDRHGFTTQAVVVGRREGGTGRNPIFYITYEFVIPGGKHIYRDTAETPGTLYDSVVEGSAIDIVYLPDNPEISNIQGYSAVSPILKVIIGTLLSIAPVVSKWDFWKNLLLEMYWYNPDK